MSRQSDLFILPRVRLFYPNIWQARRGMPGKDGVVKEGKCGTSILLYDKNAVDTDYQGKDDASIATVQKHIIQLCQDNNPTQDPKTKQGAIVPPERMCLRKGWELGKPEIFSEGMWRLNCSVRQPGESPTVLGQYTARPITTPEENDFYSGCLANVKVRVRWMDAFKSDEGEPVSAMALCELIAIQFADDGEPLDASYVSEEDAVEGFMPAEGQPMEAYDSGAGDAPKSDADMFG